MRLLILKLKRVKLNFSLEIGNDDDFVGWVLLKMLVCRFGKKYLWKLNLHFLFFYRPEKIRLALQKEVKYTIPLTAIKLGKYVSINGSWTFTIYSNLYM